MQPMANAKARQNGSNNTKTVAVGCDQLPEEFRGKEGSAVRARQGFRATDRGAAAVSINDVRGLGKGAAESGAHGTERSDVA